MIIISKNNLGKPLQSTYRHAHATEYASIKCEIMEFVPSTQVCFGLIGSQCSLKLILLFMKSCWPDSHINEYMYIILNRENNLYVYNVMFSRCTDLKCSIPQQLIAGSQWHSINTPESTPITFILMMFRFTTAMNQKATTPSSPLPLGYMCALMKSNHGCLLIASGDGVFLCNCHTPWGVSSECENPISYSVFLKQIQSWIFHKSNWISKQSKTSSYQSIHFWGKFVMDFLQLKY